MSPCGKIPTRNKTLFDDNLKGEKRPGPNNLGDTLGTTESNVLCMI